MGTGSVSSGDVVERGKRLKQGSGLARGALGSGEYLGERIT